MIVRILLAAALASATATATAAPEAPAAKKPMTYDCSKAGNKTKTACKGSIAPAAAPALVEAKTSTGKTVHYDCAKPGNKTKAACSK